MRRPTRMNVNRSGFISTEYINFLLLVYALAAIAILVFGTWLSQAVVILVPMGFCAWAFWFDYRYMRFRVGDRVLVTHGPHDGKTGTVVASHFAPYGARITIDGDGGSLIDFPMGRDLRKLNTRRLQDGG